MGGNVCDILDKGKPAAGTYVFAAVFLCVAPCGGKLNKEI